MMRNGKTAGAIIVALFSLALSACEKTDTAEGKGAAERAGAQIDEAAKKAAVELNKLAEKAGEGMAAAGQKLQNKAEEAQKSEGAEKKEPQQQ